MGRTTWTFTKEKHFWVKMKEGNKQDLLSSGKNPFKINQLGIIYISIINPSSLSECRFLAL